MKARLVSCAGLFVAVTLAGCGGMASQAPAAETGGESVGGMHDGQPMMVEPTLEEQQTVSGYGTDVEALQADFDASLALSGGPDCEAAGQLADRICDLSDRVCDIASRHPGWSDVETKCEDGRGRCERARSEVATRCE